MRTASVASGEHPAEPSGDAKRLARAQSKIRVGAVVTSSMVNPGRVADRLSQLLRRRVLLRTYSTYARVVEAVSDGDVDLAWLPPIAYVRARRQACVELLATVERDGKPAYASALLGRPGVIRDWASVEGKRAAWVDNWSAAGYVVPRRLLRERGISPDLSLQAQGFLGSYDAVLDALATGAADLGASFCQIDAKGKIVRRPWVDELDVLAVSEAIPGDTFCAARTADALLVEDVREAITTKEMSEVIVELGGSRLVEGNPARYDALERELFTNG
ncbi:MAG: PhnD/SsuA/transferrin family substrate-binding protein [Sandaracinus sp.]